MNAHFIIAFGSGFTELHLISTPHLTLPNSSGYFNIKILPFSAIWQAGDEPLRLFEVVSWIGKIQPRLWPWLLVLLKVSDQAQKLEKNQQ